MKALAPILVILFLCSAAHTAQAQLTPLTAKEGYAAAFAKAQTEFAADVYLANIFYAPVVYNSIQVTLDMSTGQATGWLYRFYSPTKDSTTLYIAVKVILLGVQAMQPPVGTTIPLPPLPGVLQFADPWVDSPAAITGAKNGGGGTFLAAHPAAIIDLIITINSPVDNPLAPKGKYWLIRFAEGTENLTCAVEAETGVSVNCGSLTDIAGAPGATDLHLDAARPQPLSLSSGGQAEFTLTLMNRQRVRLSIVDLLGRDVALLRDGEFEAGSHTMRIDAALLPDAGLYFLLCRSAGGAELRKLLVTR
jgi:hypothetical protein